jgi:hypothetical protein
MTAFSLSLSEGLTLSTLLHLPIQSGSLLCDWLALSGVPLDASGSDPAPASLTEKGYLLAGDKDQPIPTDLVRSLTVAAVNPADISLLFKRNGRLALTRFAQAGKGLVQYGMDGDLLSLHPSVDLQSFVDTLLPDWFVVDHDDGLQVEMPLAALALFNQAVALADLAAGDTLFESDSFKKKDLLNQAALSPDRLSLSLADAASPTDPGPWDEHLKRLIASGLLRKVTAASFAVGPAGQPLAAVLSDPDLCSLTISVQSVDQADALTGVFLSGAGRLFLLDTAPERLLIRQLASRQDAHAWLLELFSGGIRPLALDFPVLASR